MYVEDWFIYLGVGALAIFIWRVSPYSKWLSNKSNFLKDLQACDLCIGMWAYLILTIFMPVNMFKFYVIGVSQFLSAMITAFIFYVLHAGWDTLFRSIIIASHPD